ncbi:hypothetical protein [Arthrobacter sp. JSM 101049]|uniref:hypothetical protein n=1 Tax=Arthrobacter sp. JSM 101049 TaxID=929097 RepID=UPI00356570E2
MDLDSDSRAKDLLGSWERPSRHFIIGQSCCAAVVVAVLVGIWAATVDPAADIRAEWLAACCILAAAWGLLQTLFWLYFGRGVPWRRRWGLGGLYLRAWPWMALSSAATVLAGNVLAALLILPTGYYSDDLEGGRWLYAIVASLLSMGAGLAGCLVVAVAILPLTWFLSVLFPARSPPPDAPYANDLEMMWPGERLAGAVSLLAVAAALVAAVFAALAGHDGMPLWCVATWVVSGVVLIGCVVANNRTVTRRKASGERTPFDDGLPAPGWVFWLNR